MCLPCFAEYGVVLREVCRLDRPPLARYNGLYDSLDFRAGGAPELAAALADAEALLILNADAATVGDQVSWAARSDSLVSGLPKQRRDLGKNPKEGQ